MKINEENRKKIIVALDVHQLDDARSLIKTLLPYVGCFKIGLEALMAYRAWDWVQMIHGEGGRVFLDGKFHDIPNTVGAAAKVVSTLGVEWFNVHASGGCDAIRAAAQNKGKSKLLVVTVLTSISNAECERIYREPVISKVKQFAQDALEAGADGLVCSPEDLKELQSFPEFSKLEKVTPGVRPSWAAAGDQKRILTPAQAIAAGATALVIGRPITQPPRETGSPAEAAQRILDEMNL